MKFSIYTSIYNIENGLFDWIEALENFSSFADEVIVATSSYCKDKSIKILQDYATKNPQIKVIIADLSFDDPAFDGKLKNTALQNCSNEYCILLDADERINISQKSAWEDYANLLNAFTNADACFIPVIDIYQEQHLATSINSKWYLHKNFKGLKRGVYNGAGVDENGKWDVCKSDSCELVREDGSLAMTISLVNPDDSFSSKERTIIDYNMPLVFHIGGLDIDKRKKQDEFWSPVWENRSKTGQAEKPNRENMTYFKHKLGWWR